MNTLAQLVVGYLSSVLVLGGVAVVASGIDVPAQPPTKAAVVPASKLINDGNAFREVQRQREAWQSTQEHFRQMDRIRSRSW